MLKTRTKKNYGFTLIEVILAISLISLIAGLSVPILRTFQISNDLELATENLAEALRRTKMYAVSSREDSNWGIKIQENGFVIFRGNDYSNRDISDDEKIDFSSNIGVGGLEEIVFEKFNGDPKSSGSITLSSDSGETHIINLNVKGTVSY